MKTSNTQFTRKKAAIIFITIALILPLTCIAGDDLGGERIIKTGSFIKRSCVCTCDGQEIGASTRVNIGKMTDVSDEEKLDSACHQQCGRICGGLSDCETLEKCDECCSIHCDVKFQSDSNDAKTKDLARADCERACGSSCEFKGGINSIIDILYGIAGAIGGLMLTFYGIRFMTTDDPGDRREAKKSMVHIVVYLMFFMMVTTGVKMFLSLGADTSPSAISPPSEDALAEEIRGVITKVGEAGLSDSSSNPKIKHIKLEVDVKNLGAKAGEFYLELYTNRSVLLEREPTSGYYTTIDGGASHTFVFDSQVRGTGWNGCDLREGFDVYLKEKENGEQETRSNIRLSDNYVRDLAVCLGGAGGEIKSTEVNQLEKTVQIIVEYENTGDSTGHFQVQITNDEAGTEVVCREPSEADEYDTVAAGKTKRVVFQFSPAETDGEFHIQLYESKRGIVDSDGPHEIDTPDIKITGPTGMETYESLLGGRSIHLKFTVELTNNGEKGGCYRVRILNIYGDSISSTGAVDTMWQSTFPTLKCKSISPKETVTITVDSGEKDGWDACTILNDWEGKFQILAQEDHQTTDEALSDSDAVIETSLTQDIMNNIMHSC